MNGVGLIDELGRISRTGAALCARTICLAGGTMLLLWAGPAGAVAQAPTDWRSPPGHEQLLSDSLDCWEPALAVGPHRHVFVVAGRRTAPLRTSDFDQKLVIWRSNDAGATFSTPSPVTTEGHFHYDQRMAVDAKGTIYVSYMDNETARPRSVTRLRLARSRDEGRTFSVETVTTQRVSDKPELAVSADGTHIAIVYESSPGPALVASDDGGATWSEPRVVVQAEGRHFWPETLAIAPDGGLWFAVPSMPGAEIAAGKQTLVRLHVFRSSDGGRQWHDSDFGSSPRFVKDCAHDPDCRVKAADIAAAIDDRGHAYVTYMEGTGPGQPYALFLRSSTDAGRSWSKPQVVSAAPRPRSGDLADHDFPMIAASGAGRVCVVWVDDRRGALDVWARCSSDAGETWGPDVLFSDRSDGAAYKSSAGFKTFYGHYGGVAIDGSDRLHAAWGEGEPEYRTGAVWFNSIDLGDALRR
jgi:hypothetical protein